MKQKTGLLLTCYTPGAGPNAPYYTLHCVESDSSRLRYEEGSGTILDKSMPRTFAYIIYERDAKGYCADAGSFASNQAAAWDNALMQIFSLAGITQDEAHNAAPLKTT